MRTDARNLFHLKENQLINVINYIWVFPPLKYQLSTDADGLLLRLFFLHIAWLWLDNKTPSSPAEV